MCGTIDSPYHLVSQMRLMHLFIYLQHLIRRCAILTRTILVVSQLDLKRFE